MLTPLLQVSKLNIDIKHLNSITRIVKNVTFKINSGETFALLGESGSGKTMTALAINALLPVNAVYSKSSSIKLKSQELLDLSEQQMRVVRGSKIAMIFQEPMTALNPVLTIGTQICEVLRQHNKSISNRQGKIKAIDLLQQVGIPDPKRCYNQYPHQLSGGMKQRAMIAAALSVDPVLLIADEPTTALDVTIQAQILRLLRSIQEKTGMAILLISHNFGVVAAMADRVAVMYHGEIVEAATTKQFFQGAKNTYSQQLFAALPNMQQGQQYRQHKKCDLHQQQPILTVEKLRVNFPVVRGLLQRKVATVKAVDGVSLRLYPGQTFALVGESGCGKTTLSRAILRLIKLSSGSIKYLDQDIFKLRRKQTQQLYRKLQIIFQDPYSSLDPRWSVAKIIAEGLISNKVYKHKDQYQARVIELLTAVGLTTNSYYRYPHEFSGGQRQRISLARALALQPEVIVCDEPTSALDVSVQNQVLKLLQQLQQQHKLAFLLITHDIAVVAAMADFIAVMYLGRIVEQGEVEQVLNSPKHPYTQALLSAVPSITKLKHLETIVGEQPSPVSPPSGCHFHPRCLRAMPKCKNNYPGWSAISSKQAVKCHLYDDSTT